MIASGILTAPSFAQGTPRSGSDVVIPDGPRLPPGKACFWHDTSVGGFGKSGMCDVSPSAQIGDYCRCKEWLSPIGPGQSQRYRLRPGKIIAKPVGTGPVESEVVR